MRLLLRACYLLLTLFLIRPVDAQTGLHVPELAHYDSRLGAFFERHHVPGAAVAVAHKGRLVYSRGFGLADVGTGELVQPESRFRIASISKPMTATAILRLVEDGELALSDPAFSYLDDLTLPRGRTEDERLRTITIRDLLRHSGGWDIDLMGYDPMFNSTTIAQAMGITPPADPETIIRYMRGQPLNFDPGSRYSYSNFGYAVLGAIIERVTGQDYEDFVLSVFEETGMSRTQIGGTRIEDRLPDEVRYYYNGGALRRSVFPPHDDVLWPYGGFYLEGVGSAGGWVSSAPDVIRMMEAIDGRPGRPDVLSANSISQMTRRPPLSTWANTTYWYGLGLNVNTYNNWWHTGALPGNRAYVVRTQYADLTYVVLMNIRFDRDTDFINELDDILFAAAEDVPSWPTHDLFATESAAELPPKTRPAPEMDVWPNPTHGETSVALRTDTAGDVRIAVYDLLGREVALLHEGKVTAGIVTLNMDGQGFVPGIYIIRATTADDVISLPVSFIR